MKLASLVLSGLLGLSAVPQMARAEPPPLTADGWGRLRIGMRESEAVRLFHLRTPPDDGVNSKACRVLEMPGQPQIGIMAQSGRITRISLYRSGPLHTDHGFGVGSAEAGIKRAYGKGLKIEPSAYEDEPAHYLTFWTVPGKRGVRYETGPDRRVDRLHVGDNSIEYVEGCL